MWWNPTTWVRHLIETEVLREPEWDRESLDMLMSLRSADAELGPHGIPMSRATDPDAKFRADPMPVRDKAQAALNAAKERYYKEWPDADRSADIWTVEELD